MRKLIISSALFASLFLVWCTLVFTPPAFAATSGQITGKLLDGSNNNAPLSNQPVTLQAAEGTSAHDVKTIKTDAQGTFAFTQLDTNKLINYVVYTKFQGAQYTSGSVALDSKPQQSINLQVYESTSSTKDIAVLQSTLLFQQPDPTTGVMHVSEIVSFQNLNKKTYVGSLDASHGKPNALLFSLPSAVSNVTLGDGFSGYQVIQVNNGFATNAALLPGANDFSFSYDLPYSGTKYDFTFQTQYPTVEQTFLFDTSLRASSAQLTSQGLVNNDQQVYHSYRAVELPAQSNISVDLEGLPVTSSNLTSPSRNSTLIWLLAALVVMIAIVVLTWFLYRSRRSTGGNRVGLRKSRVAAAKAERDASEEELKQSSEDKRRQALLEELLALDEQYKAGDLSEQVYEERRSKAKARLRNLISEQETSRT